MTTLRKQSRAEAPKPGTQAAQFVPILTPHGRLLLAKAEDALPLAPEFAHRLQSCFERGSGHGLLELGAGQAGAALPPVFGYWRDFAARYVTAVCATPDLGEPRAPAAVPAPPRAELESLAAAAAPMSGAEYLHAAVLRTFWDEIEAAFRATHTPRLSAQARAQHLPLGQALREYASAANKENLLSLLLSVQRVAAESGVGFAEAMRMLASADIAGGSLL